LKLTLKTIGYSMAVLLVLTRASEWLGQDGFIIWVWIEEPRIQIDDKYLAARVLAKWTAPKLLEPEPSGISRSVGFL
jgi:hypothetical protein